MSRFYLPKWFRPLGAMIFAVVLTGCTSVNFDRSVSATNESIPGFTQGKLELAQTQEQTDARKLSAQTLLERPLGQGEAVQLALLNSPAMQALLAENWAIAANAAQTGRLSNPVFMLERMTYPNELELVRMISLACWMF